MPTTDSTSSPYVLGVRVRHTLTAKVGFIAGEIFTTIHGSKVDVRNEETGDVWPSFVDELVPEPLCSATASNDEIDAHLAAADAELARRYDPITLETTVGGRTIRERFAYTTEHVTGVWSTDVGHDLAHKLREHERAAEAAIRDGEESLTIGQVTALGLRLHLDTIDRDYQQALQVLLDRNAIGGLPSGEAFAKASHQLDRKTRRLRNKVCQLVFRCTYAQYTKALGW